MRLYTKEHPKVEDFLSKIGTNKEEIKSIFIQLIREGYNINYDLRFIGNDGVSRCEKKTEKEKPIIKIYLDKNDSYSIDRIELLKIVYESTRSLIDTFSDKFVVKIETNSLININIDIELPVETDKDRISITKSELKSMVSDLIQDSITDEYYFEENEYGSFSDIKYDIKLNDATEKFLELSDKHKPGDNDDVISNDFELNKIENYFDKKLITRLEKKFKKKFKKIDNYIYYDANGEWLRLIKYTNYLDDLNITNNRERTLSKRMGFFKKSLTLTINLVYLELRFDIE